MINFYHDKADSSQLIRMKGFFFIKISELKKDIKQLSVQDRASLAQWIIQNLDDIEEDVQAVDAEWRREVRTRVNEIRKSQNDSI